MPNPVMEELRAKEEIAAQATEQLLVEALDAFGNYYRWMDTAYGGALNDQGVDAQKRIRQTTLIVKKLNGLLASSREQVRKFDYDFELEKANGTDAALAEWRDRVGSTSIDNDETDWIELLTEQFYWCAFRARNAVTHLPGLRAFKAVGVRNVRVKLIEHPEGANSRVFNGGFAWGGERGPVLAALRPDGAAKVWPDPGLFINCDEFSSNLIKTVRNHLADPARSLGDRNTRG